MDVTLHTPDTIYSPRHVPSWLLLAGAAGTVNGMGFLACQQFVTHISGTVTNLGMGWSDIERLMECLTVVGSFTLGAAASVITIQARANQGKRPRWAVPLVSVAAILALAGVAGQAGCFGPFGRTGDNDLLPSTFLAVLAFAMGLQNASVASTTGLAVRTTHLTGPATDLGIHLGTACLAEGEEFRAAMRGAALRAGKVVAFLLGAALAVPLAIEFGYLGLLVPAICILVAAGLSFTRDWSPSDYPVPRARARNRTY